MAGEQPGEPHTLPDSSAPAAVPQIHPHLKALVDKAGGFASHADIDTLPVPVEVTTK